VTIRTLAEVRARCRVDPITHCWHWLGGFSAGAPRMHGVDLDHADKRCMPGPRAVWYIAHNEPLRGRLVYRACMCTDCVCPAHLRTAFTKAEIGEHMRRVGNRKGTSIEQRRANVILAQQARGIVATAPEIVAAIRAAPAALTHTALAARHGLAVQTVHRIRRGLSHRGLLA
jgi:hypothetical protein